MPQQQFGPPCPPGNPPGEGTALSRTPEIFGKNIALESPLGVVFQYLMHNPKLPSQMGKQKGVEAIAAFWRPFAFQMQGQVNDDELKVLDRPATPTRSTADGVTSTDPMLVPPGEEGVGFEQDMF